MVPLVNSQFPVPIRDVTEEEVVNMNGAGPVLFQFGQTNAWAKQKFTYTASVPTFPALIDCFCDGDNLAVFVDKELFTWTGLGADTIGSPYCENYEADPQLCFWKAGFLVRDIPRYTNFTLYFEEGYSVPPGKHEVEIFSLSSPFGQGYAILAILIPNGFLLDYPFFGSKSGLKDLQEKYSWGEFQEMLEQEKKSGKN